MQILYWPLRSPRRGLQRVAGQGREVLQARGGFKPVEGYVLNAPRSRVTLLARTFWKSVRGRGEMVFRTAGATATLMICLAGAGGQALAQYYPPPQAYPP